jgi:hypothetical protein
MDISPHNFGFQDRSVNFELRVAGHLFLYISCISPHNFGFQDRSEILNFTSTTTMRQLRTIAWSKPLVLACVALSIYVPLFYIDWVVVDLFIVSKDEHQVRNDKVRKPAVRKVLCFLSPFMLVFIFAGY